MQEVIDLILIGIKGGYEILNNFEMTVYGFTFSMWDFLTVLFVLSLILPLFVAPNSSGGIPNLAFGGGVSERNERVKAEEVDPSLYKGRSSRTVVDADFHEKKYWLSSKK